MLLNINLIDVLNDSEAIYNPMFNGEKTEIAFKLEKFDCKRYLKGIYTNPSDLIFNQTTCGLDAFHRGPHQRSSSSVITFFLFQNFPIILSDFHSSTIKSDNDIGKFS